MFARASRGGVEIVPALRLPLVALHLFLLQTLLFTPSAVVGRNVTQRYAAICAVGRDENRYIREWVEYHKCLGFSRIYIYDHASKEPMSARIQDHIDSGFVNVTYFEGHHKKFKSGYSSGLDRFSRTAQGYAYKQCVKRHRKKHAFLGFIDIDEFVVLTDPNITNINQLLQPYEEYGGLSLHWVLVGPNNHTQRPNSTVVDSYTTCLPRTKINHRQFKSFVSTQHQPQMSSPHRCKFRKPANGKSYLVNEDFRKIKRGFTNRPTHKKAAVYHYVTKSWEDYSAKLERGGGAGVTRDSTYFKYMSKKAVEACTEPRDLLQRLQCRAGTALPAPAPNAYSEQMALPGPAPNANQTFV